MSGDTTVEHIDAVDAFARSLYLRAKSSPSFADVAPVLRQLHLALRHLRVEAADPDSLLNATDASVYARQLRPIVEDCEFALKQLETVLDKYGDASSPDEPGVAERIAAIRNKLTNERTNVDMFLDTVQLHNPASSPPRGLAIGTAASAAPGLEDIKDKVDAVAKRVFTRSSSGGLSAEDDGLWQEFKAELEKEGFSPQVLRKHKDILRAYIRELESMSSLNGGAPPTVRGLLEYEAQKSPGPPKEMMGDIDNEKFPASIKMERPMPEHAPVPPPPQQQQQYQPYHHSSAQPSYEHHSSSSDDAPSEASDSLAMISTRDLMAMDSLNAGMAAMHMQPGHNYGASPSGSNQKYLSSGVAGALPASYEPDLSASPNAGFLSASPRAIPQTPAYATSGAAPPPYGTSPRYSSSRLAPDRYGHEIPLDAHWTRIKRTLVSSEVLERAGVRYEARPEYVAILGRLSREEIAEFARQSADCRAAREKRVPRSAATEKFRAHVREDSKSSRDDDDDEDDKESVLWDSSDSTDCDDDKTSDKGTKSYPYIVNPPDKKKASPSSTVPPKPILKNKNENHVRFDPEPYEVEGKSPRSLKDREDRDRRHHHGSHHHRRSRDHRESSSRHEKHSGRHRSSSDADHHRRDRDRDRKGDDRRDDRHSKKKAWGETLGAVGIGGAAVSLISVLAEAASGI